MNDPLEKSNPTQAEYFKDIVGTIREPLLVLDADLRVLAANRNFYKFFKVKTGETIGQLIYDIGNSQWDIPGLRLLLETILPQKAAFQDFNVEHDFPVIGRRILLLNARRISRLPNKAAWILLAFEDITERIEMERKLQASEQRFRRAFETAQDGMLLIEKTGGQVLDSNQSAEAMLGYSKRSLRKKNLWELGILKDERQFKQTSLDLEERGVVDLVDKSIPTRGGGIIPADIYLMDRAAVIQCNIRDISERKKAEEKSETERILLRTLIDNLPDRIYVMDAKGRKIISNMADWQASGGKKMEDILGKTDLEIYPPELGQDFWAVDKSVIDSGNPIINREETGLDFQGKLVSILSTKVPLRDGQGKIIGLVGTGRDITERNQAEALHNQSEALFRALFELSPDSIVLIDPHDPKESWPIIDCNQAACLISGYQRDELIGQSIDILNAKPGTQAERTAYRKQLREAGTLNYEVLHCQKNGTVFPVEVSTTVFAIGGRELVLGIDRDITERKRAENALRESETRYRGLFENSPVSLWEEDFSSVKSHIEELKHQGITDFREFLHGHPDVLLDWINGIKVLDVNQATLAMERAASKEQLIGNLKQVVRIDAHSGFLDEFVSIAEGKNSFIWKNINYTLDGEKLFVSLKLLAEPGYEDSLGKVMVSLIDITKSKLAEEALRESEEKYRSIFENIQDVYYESSLDGTVLEVSPSIEVASKGQYHREDLIGSSMYAFYADTKNRDAIIAAIQKNDNVREFEVMLKNRDNSLIPCSISAKILYNAQGNPEKIIGNMHDISERKKRDEEIRSRNDELTTLYQLSRTLSDANDLETVIELVNRQVVENVHTTFACIALLEEGYLVPRAVYPVRDQKNDFRMGDRQSISSLPACQRVLKKNEPVILQAGSPEVNHAERAFLLLDFARSVCLIPLRVGDASQDSGPALGLLILGEAREQKRSPLTPEKIRLARSFGDQAASAIRRLLLREQTGHRLQRLTALSNIDRAISSTFDLHISLGLLLKHVTEQLGVDATDVLLFQPASNTLEFSAGLGFRTKAFEHARLRLGEGYAGQAASKREIVHIQDLAGQHDNPLLEKHLAEEQFVSYFGVPLIAKGEIKGVLEIFQRARLEPDMEWLNFLDTLAWQAAIAIDSVMQFENVQRSNSELSLAYDETIEGWSHALDLRDKETEGHTQRVTEMTVKLAGRVGLNDKELMQVRWGALLHDIGKMGIPDGILLKPGPLTDEEWLVMKKHPEFAYEMLAPIHYLKAALVIPYCHHEKWDGSGYPRGLQGEQIPLAARIFAVVDVWDALISDRPYRKAWTKDKVLEHMKAESGKHFDPQVLDAFLGMKEVANEL